MEDELQPVPNPLADLRALLADETTTYEDLYQAFRKVKPRHPYVTTQAIEQRSSRHRLIYVLSQFIDNAERAIAFEAARAERKAAKADAVVIDLTTGTRALEEGGGEEEPEGDTPELLKLRERSSLIAQRAKLQNTMAVQTTDEGRAALIAQIDALTEQIEALTKEVETEEEFAIPDTLEGVKDALNLARQRKSKHEKFLKDEPENKLVPKWQAKVASEAAKIERLIIARDAYGK